jgi:hypothetical protein
MVSFGSTRLSIHDLGVAELPVPAGLDWPKAQPEERDEGENSSLLFFLDGPSPQEQSQCHHAHLGDSQHVKIRSSQRLQTLLS